MKDGWVEQFMEMDSKKQLDIALSIKNELDFNESVFDDEYDKEKSKIVASFFEQLRFHLASQNRLKDYGKLLIQFDALSKENKGKAFEEIYNLVENYGVKQRKEEQKSVCQSEGHVFGSWEHVKWTTFEKAFIDHQIIPNYPVDHDIWRRTCQRCGFVEEVDKKSDVVVKKRHLN